MNTRPDGYVSLKAAIFDYLRVNDFVTFAELMVQFPEIVGNEWMAIQTRNHVVWNGLTNDAIDAIEALYNEKRCFYWIVPPSVYVAFGITLNMPVFEGQHSMTAQHWVPVVLHRRAPTEDEMKMLANALVQDVNGWRDLKAELKKREH